MQMGEVCAARYEQGTPFCHSFHLSNTRNCPGFFNRIVGPDACSWTFPRFGSSCLWTDYMDGRRTFCLSLKFIDLARLEFFRTSSGHAMGSVYTSRPIAYCSGNHCPRTVGWYNPSVRELLCAHRPLAKSLLDCRPRPYWSSFQP